MRIAVISDTHGSRAAIRRAVRACGPVDRWLHAGDYSQDGAILAQETGGQPVTAVAGNCDGWGVAAKAEEFIEAGGKLIWLTHGHHYRVKSGLTDLIAGGRRHEADIVVYGHTHRARIDRLAGMLLLNPGSAALAGRNGERSCGVLEIGPDGRVAAQIIDLN